MKRTASSLFLSAVSIGGVVTLLTGCPEEKKVEPPAPAQVAPAPAAAAPTAATGTAAGTATPTTAPAAAPAGKGDIKGQIAFTGKAPDRADQKRAADPFCNKTKAKDESVIVNANGTLKNVVVRVSGVPGDFPAATTPAHVDQMGCNYTPHVQVVMAGQPIAVKNGDQTLHNVHTYKGATTLFNQAQVAGSAAIEKKFSDKGVVIKFKCDVHPWMTGYVAVAENPFFAVTGDDGSFEIKDVPAGKWTVEAWHESFGMKKAEITVAPGAPAEAKLTFDAADKAN